VGAELFHTDGHEADSRFSQFCESAQKTLELLLLLVIPVVCVTTLAHSQNIPNPTLPLLLSIYIASLRLISINVTRSAKHTNTMNSCVQNYTMSRPNRV
jgi:uncharacterized membrane protein AbrB (regulator of aidB expression)